VSGAADAFAGLGSDAASVSLWPGACEAAARWVCAKGLC